MKHYRHLFIIFFIAMTGGVAGYFLASLTHQALPSAVTSSQETQVSKVTYDNQTATTKAVETIQEAVVSVINYQPSASQASLFGQMEEELAVAGEGSGVIYKKEGKYAYLVTNTHVVAGAEKIDIQLSSGEKVEGELVGADTYSDIAVIKISAEKVTTLANFADSDTINVGEVAIAIGSPLGTKYANSVTQGIVSSLSRTVTSQTEDGQTVSTNAIQTDTAINPGNSGGPLINLQGQVIGITSSKIASTSRYSTGVSVEGMGFAIPSNDAVNIVNQLEKDGKVIRPALGIQMVDLASLSSSQLKLANLEDTDLTAGVLILDTQTGLPAHGKLEKYDVITAIGEDPIASASDLQSALYKHQIGQKVTITYYRNHKKQTVEVTLTHSTEDLQ